MTYHVQISRWLGWVLPPGKKEIPFKKDRGAHCTFKGLKKWFWYLSGCSVSKGHSGSFCAALIKGIEPEKKMTEGINFDNQLYK